MFKKRKTPLIILTILLAVLIIGSFMRIEGILAGDEAKGRIAYVDVQSIYNVHPEKIAAEKKLNDLALNLQTELDEKAQELSKKEQQDMLDQYQAELSKEEEELIQEVLNKIDETITEVAMQKEVKIVLDKRNVIYGGYDITQDVIDYIKKIENEENKSANEEENSSNTVE